MIFLTIPELLNKVNDNFLETDRFFKNICVSLEIAYNINESHFKHLKPVNNYENNFLFFAKN